LWPAVVTNSFRNIDSRRLPNSWSRCTLHTLRSYFSGKKCVLCTRIAQGRHYV